MPPKKQNEAPLTTLAKTIADAAKTFHSNFQKIPGGKTITTNISSIASKTSKATQKVTIIKQASKTFDSFTKKTPLLRNVRKGIELSQKQKKTKKASTNK